MTCKLHTKTPHSQLLHPIVIIMVQEFDVAVRAQALTLHAEGNSRAMITAKTGYTSSGFSKLLQKAKSRGYVPGNRILLEYVSEAPGRGRPKGSKTRSGSDNTTDNTTDDATETHSSPN